MQERNQGGGGGGGSPHEQLFTTLADLLTPASTIPLLDAADDELIDRLYECLPPQLVATVQASVDTSALQNPDSSAEEKQAAQRALTVARKEMLRRVLHSPQFSQSLASLTVALREGGLPIIAETIGVPVRNGGYLRHGGVPMGGGEAVEAFIEGVRRDVEDKLAKEDDDAGGDRMEHD
jgi:26S proteasome regulatory subunit N13